MKIWNIFVVNKADSLSRPKVQHLTIATIEEIIIHFCLPVSLLPAICSLSGASSGAALSSRGYFLDSASDRLQGCNDCPQVFHVDLSPRVLL